MASIDISEERGVRYLHFGSHLIQGAMRIARPWSLELEYTRAMMTPLLFCPRANWPRRVLQIGLGAASVTKFLHRHLPSSNLTVVEIKPEVIAAARQFFHLPDDSRRLSIEAGDGYAAVTTSSRQFDLILVDGFDARGGTGMLETLPFYCGCQARIGRGGMVAINLLGRRRGAKAAIERIEHAFDGRVIAMPCEAGNIVAVAATGVPIRRSFDDLRASARKLRTTSGLDLGPLVTRLQPKPPNKTSWLEL